MGEHRNKPVPLIGSKCVRVYEHTDAAGLTLQLRWVRLNTDGSVWSVENGAVSMAAKTGDDLLALLNECGKALMMPSVLPSDVLPAGRVLS